MQLSHWQWYISFIRITPGSGAPNWGSSAVWTRAAERILQFCRKLCRVRPADRSRRMPIAALRRGLAPPAAVGTARAGRSADPAGPSTARPRTCQGNTRSSDPQVNWVLTRPRYQRRRRRRQIVQPERRRRSGAADCTAPPRDDARIHRSSRGPVPMNNSNRKTP